MTPSAQQVRELLHRDLRGVKLCAVTLDGVEFEGEHLLVGLGIEQRCSAPRADDSYVR